MTFRPFNGIFTPRALVRTERPLAPIARPPTITAVLSPHQLELAASHNMTPESYAAALANHPVRRIHVDRFPP